MGSTWVEPVENQSNLKTTPMTSLKDEVVDGTIVDPLQTNSKEQGTDDGGGGGGGTIAQQRSEAIDKASAQTGTDAIGLKTSAEAALWADAEKQGSSLVATAEAAAAPLKDKPKKKTAEEAISAVSAVPLDITTASLTAQKMVTRWAADHARVRAERQTWRLQLGQPLDEHWVFDCH